MSQAQEKDTRQQVAQAIKAVESKKGEDVVILELDQASGAFTDYFIVCSGTNPRQIQAIADEVERQLAPSGLRPNSREGYNQAEWVLLDYVDFVVHIFSERARKFYDLERLWKSAQRLKPADLLKKRAAKEAPQKAATRAFKKTASARSAKARSKAGAKIKTGSRSKPRAKAQTKAKKRTRKSR
jgi:ribosome-associated protein